MAVKPAFPLDFDRLAVYFQRSKKVFVQPGIIYCTPDPVFMTQDASIAPLVALKFVVLEEM